MRERLRLLPGLVLSAALALVAIRLGTLGWLQAHGMSALTVAIVLGIVLGNTLYPYFAAKGGAGVAFSKQFLLRAGVILYGLRLTLHDIGQVGMTGVLIDALLLSSTFMLAHFLGTRFFGLDRSTSMLIGAGNAICGAAAVMATEPLLRAKAEQVTVAISTVVVFGTVAIFVYPALYDLNLHWQLVPAGTRAFGIYAGSTIHEVAQVFAAGRSISPETANTAVITKMVRVMMLAPFLIGLSGWLARDTSKAAAGLRKPAAPEPGVAQDVGIAPAAVASASCAGSALGVAQGVVIAPAIVARASCAGSVPGVAQDVGIAPAVVASVSCAGPALGAALAPGVSPAAGVASQSEPARKLTIPWFAFAFVGVVLVNSLALLPHAVVASAIDLDTFLLAMAMGSLGLTTHISAIRRAGMKPLLLGALLFVWLITGGALINDLVTGWLH